MNRKWRLLFLVALAAPWPLTVAAGEMHGTFKINGNEAAYGTELIFECPGETRPAMIREKGRYKVDIRSTGSCKVSVKDVDGAFTSLISYHERTRYNLELTGGGSDYKLRRR